MNSKLFLDNIVKFPKFVRILLNDTDISSLNLNINKTQKRVLMCINDNKGKTMQEISALVGLDKSSYSRTVDSLIEKGFLERSHSSSDRRKIELLLTPQGTNAAISIHELTACRLDGILLSRLTDEEKSEFLSALSTVTKYIDRTV